MKYYLNKKFSLYIFLLYNIIVVLLGIIKTFRYIFSLSLCIINLLCLFKLYNKIKPL